MIWKYLHFALSLSDIFNVYKTHAWQFLFFQCLKDVFPLYSDFQGFCWEVSSYLYHYAPLSHDFFFFFFQDVFIVTGFSCITMMDQGLGFLLVVVVVFLTAWSLRSFLDLEVTVFDQTGRTLTWFLPFFFLNHFFFLLFFWHSKNVIDFVLWSYWDSLVYFHLFSAFDIMQLQSFTDLF